MQYHCSTYQLYWAVLVHNLIIRTKITLHLNPVRICEEEWKRDHLSLELNRFVPHNFFNLN